MAFRDAEVRAKNQYTDHQSPRDRVQVTQVCPKDTKGRGDGWAQGVHRAGLRQGCLAGRPVIVFRRDVIGLQASAPAHPELWGLSGFQEARVRHPPLRGSQVPKCEAPGAPAFGGNDFSLPASGPPAPLTSSTNQRNFNCKPLCKMLHTYPLSKKTHHLNKFNRWHDPSFFMGVRKPMPRVAAQHTTAEPRFEPTVNRVQKTAPRNAGYAGNQAALRSLGNLKIGPADDSLEREADRVSEQVMGMTIGAQSISTSPSASTLRRSCTECDQQKDEEQSHSVHRKTVAGNTATPSSATSVNQALTSRGEPLSASQRSFFEPRFGVDFGGVRVHQDQHATNSASEIGAKAYTLGSHVVFGEGYSPREHPEVLAHELTHVVQQQHRGQSAQVQRQATPPSATHSTPQQRIHQWLEEHQFAPAVTHTPGEEVHVLLNGQNMSLTDAVALVVHELNLATAVVRPVVEAAAHIDVPLSERDSARVGPGNEVPGLPYDPQTPADRRRVDIAIELNRVDELLADNHFLQLSIPDQHGAVAQLNGQELPMTPLMDRILAELGPHTITRQSLAYHLRQRYENAPQAPSRQLILGYTLLPQSLQSVSTGNPTTLQHQFSLTGTFAHHTSTDAGAETSVQGNVTIDTSRNVTNIQAVVQEAIVLNQLHNWVQLSAFVQGVVGVAFTQTATSTAAIPFGQLGVGLQVLVNLFPDKIRVDFIPRRFSFSAPQIGAQITGSGALTFPSSTTGTAVVPQATGSVNFILNVPFNIQLN